MSAERLRMLAFRWGLVALGALAFVALRLLTTWLQVWASLEYRTDWRTLSARMSQLKPYAFKAPFIATYFWALVVLIGASLAVLFWLGIREARRPSEE